jgi:hypothetical protein
MSPVNIDDEALTDAEIATEIDAFIATDVW